MARYLVEVYMPNRGDAVARTRTDAARLARSRDVRYVRAILVPKDETCFHVVDAASADIVDGAAEEGSVRVERITEAVEISRPTLREEP
jgi:hypothetical protein